MQWVGLQGVQMSLGSLPVCPLNACGPTHEFWFAMTTKNFRAAAEVGYLEPDQAKEHKKGWWKYWYLGLRTTPQDAAERLQLILKNDFAKEDCVLVRCTFTEIGIGYYAMQQQAEAPFLPYLSKETFSWDWEQDWGVWYFRGEMLPFYAEHPHNQYPLVMCEAFQIF